MRTQLQSKTATIDIYVKLAQYPILADLIRKRMREELFSRGIVSEQAFEKEIEAMARESQLREGLTDPFNQEPANVWEERKARIRAFHTDYYFAYNLPPTLFEEIVQGVLHTQPNPTEIALAFNPELAPWEMLFRQGEMYENRLPDELPKIRHHLEEIKVVLIRGMITDQLPLIGVAKRVLSIADLHDIHERRIGRGKIGGKAAGMYIAYKILQQHMAHLGEEWHASVDIPESYYLGTDVMYEFRSLNKLDYIMNQKYRPLEEVREDYPRVMEDHLRGEFPEKPYDQLRLILNALDRRPIIVRSSSLLEDNFGSAFAGKYDSYFCPNQGTPEENLADLVQAIKRVYASTLNPDALLYREKHGLIDYDERMAILIQEVKGETFGHYFFPTLAGVGFSQNPFRWSPKIRREDGFLRLVWGLGTRAVERVATDYPRLIALSHPQLRPETTVHEIRQYSQRYVDVIDLTDNRLKTIEVGELMRPDYPYLKHIVSADAGGYLQQLISVVGLDRTDNLIVTFDGLTRDRRLVELMRNALMTIEKHYGTPVDTEFALRIIPKYPQPDYKLSLLQCRPLSQRAENGAVTIPKDAPPENVLFHGRNLIPDGKVEDIRYVLFVDPLRYREAPDYATKLELGRAISRLNRRLEKEPFILMGPGRWGSANIDLGVRVSYADIHNTKVLVEIAVETNDGVPELSYGTHFFQDLVEAGIYSLPLHLNQPDSVFRWDFFRESPNMLAQLSPPDAGLADYLRVVDIEQVRPKYRLSILMNGAQDEAMGLLTTNNNAA